MWPTREALKEGQIEGSVTQPEPSVSQVLSLLGPSVPIREPLAVRLTLESAAFPGTVPVRGTAACFVHGKEKNLCLKARPGFEREKERSALALPSHLASRDIQPSLIQLHLLCARHCAEHYPQSFLLAFMSHHLALLFLMPVSLAAPSVSFAGFSSAACSLNVGNCQGFVLALSSCYYSL